MTPREGPNSDAHYGSDAADGKSAGWIAAHDWLLSLVQPPPADIDPVRAKGFDDGYRCAVALLGPENNPFVPDCLGTDE